MARTHTLSIGTALLLLLGILTLVSALDMDMDMDMTAMERMKRAAGKKVECEMEGDSVVCNGTTYSEAEEDDFPTPRFWVDLAVSAGLVCLAGLMSGLTMGLMSIDFLNLQILANGGGTKQEQIYANRIIPLVKRHHLLLVTLLVANAAAMEALPLFVDRIVGTVGAILISVTAVLLFGEIIPQAICTRYGLAIGANLAWLVWIIIILLFPISWPISLLLDFLLGGEQGTFFRRAQLKELVSLHGEQGPDQEAGDLLAAGGELGATLTKDEVTIIKGALDLSSKIVKDTMTPIDKVFMLDIKDRLTEQKLDQILQTGHSRVPVYRGGKTNVVGMIIVKKLIKLNPERATPVSDVELVRLPTVSEDTELYPLLNLFRRGHSHMALVVDAVDHVTIRGIITLEDVFEELIQEEIRDETDAIRGIAKEMMARQESLSLMRGQSVMNMPRTIAYPM
ncbi:uncharacterized protein ACA1_208300 [Acanthamoeba castellanii str. Neff]|uniref:CBS domain containing protein n=1 Tax=Acanthamoeba castellanii (strain ATCC 30010 / Neff) TaxID=1257118 RepID=L8GYC2_ACACF|nr:uncharacterized protein ACA1_208300 [Acanthamoeba castellanii str. Neff]ELR17952.1 hypothetical protein ACA1_208300 [Acanthamoeba castellanii str. Neff]